MSLFSMALSMYFIYLFKAETNFHHAKNYKHNCYFRMWWMRKLCWYIKSSKFSTLQLRFNLIFFLSECTL